MLHKAKRRLYFLVASYFGFWAGFVLRRWKPRVVVVTGSSGKTTTLHLLEAQLGDQAIYSHHANSAIGLPFFILGMGPNVESRASWFKYFLNAPFKIFRKLPASKLFIAEADCDRPNEGKFLSKLLKPEVVLWVSVFRTHSMNFDRLVKSAQHASHEAAIAYEFGYFAEAAQKLLIVNADQPEITAQLSRVQPSVKVVEANTQYVKNFRLSDTETIYEFANKEIHLPGLHPKELGINLQLVSSLLDYLDVEIDSKYSRLIMPPGRSSVFKGKNESILIDSTYNTGLGAMTAILELFDTYPSQKKWLVLGDILEQGSLEKSEHERLAKVILSMEFEQLILLGPRIKEYTLPIIKDQNPKLVVVAYESPKDVLDYLQTNLRGGEAILFKGARFLEGVIEQLLKNPEDASKLVRREKAWVKRRQQWGLPR